MSKSSIEWTDEVWNPVTGCTRVSPGCAHCYIERTPPFRMQGRRFTRVGNEETTGVRLHPERLEQPLGWRKPRRIFVNSLSDLFHEEVPDAFIAQVFAVMGRAERHIFQLLTKRPERADALLHLWHDELHYRPFDRRSPLSNVWLGVSIENARYTGRADVLRQIPAAVRFISAEPLLGSLYHSPRGLLPKIEFADPAYPYKRLDLSGIDWVIGGGESGPGARPMHPEWARELRDACLDVCGTCLSHEGVRHECECRPAFFFKQWGEWAAHGPPSTHIASLDVRDVRAGDAILGADLEHGPWQLMRRVGKKTAGRLLDGREWNEMPQGVRTSVRGFAGDDQRTVPEGAGAP